MFEGRVPLICRETPKPVFRTLETQTDTPVFSTRRELRLSEAIPQKLQLNQLLFKPTPSIDAAATCIGREKILQMRSHALSTPEADNFTRLPLVVSTHDLPKLDIMALRAFSSPFYKVACPLALPGKFRIRKTNSNRTRTSPPGSNHGEPGMPRGAATRTFVRKQGGCGNKVARKTRRRPQATQIARKLRFSEKRRIKRCENRLFTRQLGADEVLVARILRRGRPGRNPGGAPILPTTKVKTTPSFASKNARISPPPLCITHGTPP